MKLKWTKEQLDLLKKLDLGFDPSGNLDEDKIFSIDERASDYLMDFGLDEDGPNQIGLICESIIEALVE